MSATKIWFVLVLGVTVGLFAGDKIDFSGEWSFTEEKSELDDMGTQFLPTKLVITQKGNDLSVQRVFEREYEDDWVVEEKLTLDGKECKSEFWNSPRVTTANWSKDDDTLVLDTKIVFERDGETNEVTTNEVWSLKEDGKILAIKHVSNSAWGERKVTIAYEKKEAKKPAKEEKKEALKKE
jgi:hypothetical protein